MERLIQKLLKKGLLENLWVKNINIAFNELILHNKTSNCRCFFQQQNSLFSKKLNSFNFRHISHFFIKIVLFNSPKKERHHYQKYVLNLSEANYPYTAWVYSTGLKDIFLILMIRKPGINRLKGFINDFFQKLPFFTHRFVGRGIFFNSL